jgi:hypothetical protein
MDCFQAPQGFSCGRMVGGAAHVYRAMIEDNYSDIAEGKLS